MIPKFLNDIKNEVSKLEKEYEKIIEFLSASLEKKEKYSNYWRLKEISRELKFKYRLWDSWSTDNYNSEMNLYLCKEIYFFEKCFLMLKQIYDPKYVDFQHYLKAANLEYEYFFENSFSYPEEFSNNPFDSQGITDDPRINLVLNKIEKAQKNLKLIIDNVKKKSNDAKDLFLYYEVLGDLYLHIYIILKKNEFLKDSINYLHQCYFYYLISHNYKQIVEESNPTTSYSGLHGWDVFKIFVEFFNKIGSGNIHNVRLKLEYLEQNYLSDIVISETKKEVESVFR